MVLSDQIVIMHKGRVQQIGNAVGIYRRPANRFVADFIGRANFLPVDVLGKSDGGSEDKYRVRLQGITLDAPAAESVLPGRPAVLLVRPESLRLSTQPSTQQAGDGVLQATVLRTSYLGSLAEYEIELAGQRLVVVRHDPGEADLYAPGTAVYVHLLHDNIYLLPAA